MSLGVQAFCAVGLPKAGKAGGEGGLPEVSRECWEGWEAEGRAGQGP